MEAAYARNVRLLSLLVPVDCDDGVQQEVQALLAAIRTHCQPGLMAVIAENPIAWENLCGVDGFVPAKPGKIGTTGLTVFQMVSSLSAPMLLSPVDDSEMTQVLGPADTPATLVHGVWMVADQTLVFSVEHLEIARRSSAIALFLQMELSRLSMSSAVLAEVRKIASPDICLYQSITNGLFVGPPPPCDPLLVPMLCSEKPKLTTEVLATTRIPPRLLI